MKVVDLYPLSAGVFASMRTAGVALPWPSAKDAVFDADYIGNRSGEKALSPYARSIVETSPLTAAATIAATAGARFLNRWSDLYATTVLNYDPLTTVDVSGSSESEGYVYGINTGPDGSPNARGNEKSARKGYEGTMPQKIIEAERDAAMWSYVGIVFDDLDTFITSPYYE